jgi:hypothetical protein
MKLIRLVTPHAESEQNSETMRIAAVNVRQIKCHGSDVWVISVDSRAIRKVTLASTDSTY